MRTLETVLDEVAHAQGLELESNTRSVLARYATRVAQWNRKTNLTGARDAEAFCRSFMADAFAVAPLIDAVRIVDVGSGNGLPGLVLAVLRPEATIWLLEPRARRARFLQQMRIELELRNVNVVDLRVEDWRPAELPDAIVAQAVGDLAFLVASTRHLQGAGCRLFALKGRNPESEIAALGAPASAITVRRLVVPGWSERHLVTLDCARLAVAAEA